jgi:spore maturation protein CgeB
MKILYCSTGASGSTATHRLRAFRRIFPDVTDFCYDDLLEMGIPGMSRVVDRFQLSPGAGLMNRSLVEATRRLRPDVVWLDKPIMVPRRTVEALGELGAKTIAYMPDDPYGPRHDPFWRLFKPALTAYWAHVVPREETIDDYKQRGVERVAMVPFSYEPSLHFPPERAGVTSPKDFDFTFVGYPHDNRVAWIKRLAQQLSEARFGLYGPGWDRYQSELAPLGVSCNGPVWDDQYRDVLWRSRLSISFVTRSNRDRMSRKAIEIAASGCAVMVQPSPVHDAAFKDRESAYFFEDPNSLPDLLAEILADPESLRAVAERGAQAVRQAGLANDDVYADAFRQLGLK